MLPIFTSLEITSLAFNVAVQKHIARVILRSPMYFALTNSKTSLPDFIHSKTEEPPEEVSILLNHLKDYAVFGYLILALGVPNYIQFIRELSLLFLKISLILFSLFDFILNKF